MVARVPRKQVLVQLDDRLVAELDRWAARSEVSRSELIRRAVAAHLGDLDRQEQDRTTVEAYERVPDAETFSPWTG
ncbi:MAG: CopG family transcriptional regulator [Actinobacteria bacterium]|nr:MAG: CopG family transcriptional regulator [Actinomycetota bacterium]